MQSDHEQFATEDEQSTDAVQLDPEWTSPPICSPDHSIHSETDEWMADIADEFLEHKKHTKTMYVPTVANLFFPATFFPTSPHRL